MTVAMGKHGLLSYSVLGRLMTILPAIQETSNLITWVTVFPVICKGTWVREITEVGRMFKSSFCLTPITEYT